MSGIKVLIILIQQTYTCAYTRAQTHKEAYMLHLTFRKDRDFVVFHVDQGGK